MGRGDVQGDWHSDSSQVKALGKVLVEKCICLWWPPPRERRGAPAEKWPHLSWTGLLFLGTHSWFFVKKILAFDLSRWVGLCRVFSLVCGMSALLLHRQDVISVVSAQGFTVSYWLLFTDPMRELGKKHELASLCLCSSPECIGVSFLLMFIPLHSWKLPFFPKYV